MKKPFSETISNELVTYSIEYDSKFYLFENVPARVCLETGEKYFSPEVVDKIQKTIWSHVKPKRMIKTPVYEYAWPEGERLPVTSAVLRFLSQRNKFIVC